MVQGKQSMVGTTGGRMKDDKYFEIAKKAIKKYIKNCRGYCKNKKNKFLVSIICTYGIIFVLSINIINSNVILINASYLYAIIVVNALLKPGITKVGAVIFSELFNKQLRGVFS
jgi:hypothetical protein